MSFWCLQFLPKNRWKQVDLRYHSSKVEFVYSFFGRIVGLKKSLQLCLTFSGCVIWKIRLRCTLIFSIALIYSAKPMLHSFVKYAGWHDKLANFATIKAHRDVGVRWVGWVFSNPVFGGLKLCEIDRQLQISYIPIMIAHLKNYCFLRP